MRDLETIRRENSAFVIFAAQPFDSTHVMSFLLDAGIEFKVLLGSYKNERETSFIVRGDDFNKVVESRLLIEQESVLVLMHVNSEGLRRAQIVYLDAETPDADAGYFVQVTKEDALAQDGYTYDPMQDQFFTIKTAEELLVGSGIPTHK